MATIDWKNLGFSYTQTNCHIQYVWKNGRWSDGELVESPYIPIHIAASALHYGQEAFEGLKVFARKDGKVSLFRPVENAKRLAMSARRVCMAEVPEEMFLDACQRVVKANLEFVPPYGTGGSMYVRPLLFGSGAQIGVAPASEYTFLVLVTPVGPYYKGGLQAVKAIVLDDYDRAAPRGTGHIKIGGNYAASLYPHIQAAKAGYPVELYLDPVEHKWVEEFSTSNFLAITKEGAYVTPKTPSILPSITNLTLQQIARDMGMPVDVRPIAFSEVADFTEVAACGTAVVVTPVSSIERAGTVYKTGPQAGAGPVMEKLYKAVQGIQYGQEPDLHGWNVDVD
ncbi:MAG: branched-chain amino acid aminotransferase [Verrucomicrobiota bacterium]|jgi:branched-chain amino acid aminotransferase|nr:branched-chain amino acid aminotransferase [Verrucomicrobiota bacterium]